VGQSVIEAPFMVKDLAFLLTEELLETMFSCQTSKDDFSGESCLAKKSQPVLQISHIL
jgi:hypothetical protein